MLLLSGQQKLRYGISVIFRPPVPKAIFVTCSDAHCTPGQRCCCGLCYGEHIAPSLMLYQLGQPLGRQFNELSSLHWP